MLQRSTVKWASVTLAAAMTLVACGGDDGSAGATTDGGTVTISGSSTVAPISSLVADELDAAGSPTQVTVDDPGTGDGFAAFCAGEIDIADASRPIKDEEAAACEDAGIGYVELEVAFDGITVLTNSANTAVECLTFADLYALVGTESQGLERWSDAEEIAAALGSSTDLPDAPLDITAPGTESGTYDAFIEIALADAAAERLEAGAIAEDAAESTRSDYSSQADDNAIIAGIEGSESSFGWVGFAFAEGAGDGVREIAIDGGDGCVAPSLETIADGSYALSRSLYIYVSTTAAESPAVAEYVDFYLSDESLTALVEEAGYVPLPADRAAATRDAWASR